jgi:hypothetical protein
MNANKSTNEKERLVSLTTPPLETLEDMLHNRILEKKHKDTQKPEYGGHRKIMDRDRDFAMGLRREPYSQKTIWGE